MRPGRSHTRWPLLRFVCEPSVVVEFCGSFSSTSPIKAAEERYGAGGVVGMRIIQRVGSEAAAAAKWGSEESGGDEISDSDSDDEETEVVEEPAAAAAAAAGAEDGARAEEQVSAKTRAPVAKSELT